MRMTQKTERSPEGSRSIRRDHGARGFSRAIIACALALAASFTYALSAQTPANDGPQYVAGTDKLIRPVNYREWIFIGSSVGLNYPAPGQAAQPAQFENVFV